jgi:NDP-sugar pyrophosphorylase family protein
VLAVDSSGRVRDYVEKPVQHHDVSMGIYVFEPHALRYIEPACYLDLPDFVLRLLANGEKVCAYRFDGYWLDIGRPDDYSRATEEFDRLRGQLLPDLSPPSDAVALRHQESRCPQGT